MSSNYLNNINKFWEESIRAEREYVKSVKEGKARLPQPQPNVYNQLLDPNPPADYGQLPLPKGVSTFTLEDALKDRDQEAKTAQLINQYQKASGQSQQATKQILLDVAKSRKEVEIINKLKIDDEDKLKQLLKRLIPKRASSYYPSLSSLSHQDIWKIIHAHQNEVKQMLSKGVQSDGYGLLNVNNASDDSQKSALLEAIADNVENVVDDEDEDLEDQEAEEPEGEIEMKIHQGMSDLPGVEIKSEYEPEETLSEGKKPINNPFRGETNEPGPAAAGPSVPRTGMFIPERTPKTPKEGAPALRPPPIDLGPSARGPVSALPNDYDEKDNMNDTKRKQILEVLNKLKNSKYATTLIIDLKRAIKSDRARLGQIPIGYMESNLSTSNQRYAVKSKLRAELLNLGSQKINLPKEVYQSIIDLLDEDLAIDKARFDTGKGMRGKGAKRLSDVIKVPPSASSADKKALFKKYLLNKEYQKAGNDNKKLARQTSELKKILFENP